MGSAPLLWVFSSRNFLHIFNLIHSRRSVFVLPSLSCICLLRFLACCCLLTRHYNVHLTMIPSTSTKRGYGECPQCQKSCSTRWKPVHCKECGFHLGGTKEPAAKKTKSCCPSAVVVASTVEMSVISTKTSARDDRCFVVKEGDSVFCMHKECMNVRATFVSSPTTQTLHEHSCILYRRDVQAILFANTLTSAEMWLHLKKFFELTTQKIASYNGDSASKGPSASTGEHCICIVSDLLWLGLVWSCFVFCLLFLLFYVICAPVLTEGTASKELLTELLGSESSLAAVVQVSDLSFAVRGFPSTNNTLGYSHVKIVDGVLVWSSNDTDCKSFVAKGKYERAKKFCVHLHAIFCTGGYRQETLPPALLCISQFQQCPSPPPGLIPGNYHRK